LVVFNRRQGKLVFYTLGDLHLHEGDGLIRLACVTQMWALRLANRIKMALCKRVEMDSRPVNSPHAVLPNHRELYDGDSKSSTVLKFVRVGISSVAIKLYEDVLEAKEVARSEERIVLEYPMVAGGHRPTNAGDFAPILAQLSKMHNDRHVHGDIRLANMVFNGKDSKLIDFDFSGEEEEVWYPDGYAKVADSKRHKDAIETWPILRDHDCFSMAHILGLFTIAGKEGEWWKITKAVSENKLDAALELLDSVSMSPLC